MRICSELPFLFICQFLIHHEQERTGGSGVGLPRKMNHFGCRPLRSVALGDDGKNKSQAERVLGNDTNSNYVLGHRRIGVAL